LEWELVSIGEERGAPASLELGHPCLVGCRDHPWERGAYSFLSQLLELENILLAEHHERSEPQVTQS
jgi:hypothetical protein